LNVSIIDEVITVASEDSFETARALAKKEGILWVFLLELQCGLPCRWRNAGKIEGKNLL
jgi:hypothetical protein